MWKNSKFLWPCTKNQQKVKIKTIGLAHNFIISANCWNHDWRSKSNSSRNYGVHKKCFGRTDGLYLIIVKRVGCDSLLVIKSGCVGCVWEYIFCIIINMAGWLISNIHFPTGATSTFLIEGHFRRENLTSFLVGWKTLHTIAIAGARTHDLLHTQAL